MGRDGSFPSSEVASAAMTEFQESIEESVLVLVGGEAAEFVGTVTADEEANGILDVVKAVEKAEQLAQEDQKRLGKDVKEPNSGNSRSNFPL
jgi:hypothetical protein